MPEGRTRRPVLQGENDEIVDTSNAGFAREHLVNAASLEIRFIPNRGHRLAQFEWPEIRQGILNVYDRIKEQANADTVKIVASGK